MSNAVRIVEVSPRDGLQSEALQVSTEVKVDLVRRLMATGLNDIEVTAFVNPERLPQMADAEALCGQLEASENVRLSALVPNVHGLQRAQQAGINNLAFFSAASESFCQKNIGCSIEQSLQRCKQLIEQLKQQPNSRLRAYISCAFACPYEGKVAAEKVSELAAKLMDIGCDEIVLADTIGVATPRLTQQLVRRVKELVSIGRLALHLHDTRGQALANIYACLELGITTIDASVAGLGGCPFAPGATGNLATEDLVYLLEGCGVDTGIDLDRLIGVGRFISAQLGHVNQSRVGVAGGLPYEAQE
ncbi:MAG: hydroxymethylglutaryl-CoA lyase [Pseudomonadales bacterium]